jgi:hypothetical protein
MDAAEFEMARGGVVDNRATVLTQRFNYAYVNTQDIGAAMQAVNELLDTPLTLEQFRRLTNRCRKKKKGA